MCCAYPVASLQFFSPLVVAHRSLSLPLAGERNRGGGLARGCTLEKEKAGWKVAVYMWLEKFEEYVGVFLVFVSVAYHPCGLIAMMGCLFAIVV